MLSLPWPTLITHLTVTLIRMPAIPRSRDSNTIKRLDTFWFAGQHEQVYSTCTTSRL
jgi:hypothetical protein